MARSAPEPTCPDCASKDQLSRHQHFLKIGTGLAGHLHAQYVADAMGAEAEQHGQNTVSGVMAWVQTIHATYGGLINKQGEKMSALDTWFLAQHTQAQKRADRESELDKARPPEARVEQQGE